VLGHWDTRTLVLAFVPVRTHKTDTLAAITYEQAPLKWAYVYDVWSGGKGVVGGGVHLDMECHCF